MKFEAYSNYSTVSASIEIVKLNYYFRTTRVKSKFFAQGTGNKHVLVAFALLLPVSSSMQPTHEASSLQCQSWLTQL